MLIGQQRLIQLFPVETVYSPVANTNQWRTRGFESSEIAFCSIVPVSIELGKFNTFMIKIRSGRVSIWSPYTSASVLMN